MMLNAPSYPYLPSSTLEPAHHSHSPYPISSRTKTHQTILQPTTKPPTGISGISDPQTSTSISTFQLGYAGPSSQGRIAQRQSQDRAMQRALVGQRPFGVGLGKDAEDMDDEEAAMEQDAHNIGMFGHRFLLPYGRRQTQMELDAAPSPTPSQVEDDRRQEDRNDGAAGSPVTGMQQQVEIDDAEVEVEGEDEVVDLDASVEDMDASFDEGDSHGDAMDE